MSKINWQVARVALGAVGIGVGLMMGGHALMGCADSSGSSRPAASQLQQGLTLLDTHSAAWGVSAAYREGSRVVYLESRVGAPKPDVYQQSFPSEPKNEMDMRLVDGLGNTFYVQRGGDAYIDPTWADDLRQARSLKTQPSDTEREAYWGLAQRAASAVQGQLPAGFESHAFHFAQFAAAPPNLESSAIAKLADYRKALQTTEYANWSGSGTLQTYVQTWSKPIVCSLWTCVGTHTPTVMYYAQAGATVWSVAINACNHGTCGGGSGTTGGCYTNDYWFSYVSYTGETTSDLSTTGGCNSGYNWDTPPGHECNDDAAYELWQAKEGTTETSLGDMNNFNWGADANGRNFACQCGASSNSCSGDWNGPSCP